MFVSKYLNGGLVGVCCVNTCVVALCFHNCVVSVLHGVSYLCFRKRVFLLRVFPNFYYIFSDHVINCQIHTINYFVEERGSLMLFS